ncbi:MAG: hypothetical protein WDM79_12150 [Terricaulis sp.]
MLIAAAVLITVGGMVFFVRQSDQLAPAARETRIELPDAFKE